MRTYQIYYCKENQDFLIIEESFSFFAFFFSPIWLLLNKFYVTLALYLAFLSLFRNSYYYEIIVTASHVVLGAFHYKMIEYKYYLEGNLKIAKILGINKEHALIRYLDNIDPNTRQLYT